jgi:uncharacterized protein (DUF2147 family)
MARLQTRFYFLHALIAGMLFFIAMPTAFAEETSNSPVGLWRVYDDDHAPRGVIKITENQGELRGVIVKSFPVLGQTASDLCTKCTGDRQNQPIVGMTVLWGLREDGNMWAGGRVLNPYTGKIYRAYLSVSRDDQTLHMRGYIGVSLLGVSFEWVRLE